jgi:23S rRNA (uracil1939-C5)-methyltransferase
MPEAELVIDSIAAGGDGVARDDNLVVFVPRSAPGDRGVVSYTKKGAFARGRLERLESASPQRVDPICVHYDGDNCGGCQLQHISYEAQQRAKERIVNDALERIARREGNAPIMHASPMEWRYRRRLTLALQRDGESWRAGLHPYDAPAHIFQLRECPITQDNVLSTWSEILRSARLLPRARSLRGSVLHIDDGAHFSLEGGTSWQDARAMGDACPSLSAIWWTPRDEARRRVFARGAAAQTGASFAQINGLVALQLREHVLATVMKYEPSYVIDAYSGSGEIALDLSGRHGLRVTAIESDPDAVASFGARLPEGSRAITGRVEHELDAHLPADVVIVNPPRAGLHEEVTAMLASPGAVSRCIVYVSCNPATLARDLGRLPNHAIRSLHCFDMFPQTAHVETVCELAPETRT